MPFGKPVKILRYCFTVLVSSVLVGLLKGQTVHHAGSYAPMPQLTIINGTDAVISEDRDGFVYCFARLDPGGRRRSYRILWTDPYGLPLSSYPMVDVKTAKIFTAREAFVLPHSYLVFRGFDDSLAGVYTCNLLYGGRLLARRSIHLRLFRPTFRVVLLPPCLAVPEGGTLLLPSPVLGNPPKPPLWSKVGGDLDPSTSLLLNGGLLLQEVQDAGVYRAVVRLGGGLIHQQEVAVSVLLRDGEVLEPHGSSLDLSCHLSSSYSSSVAVANDLIADIQIHSYRRRVSEARKKGR